MMEQQAVENTETEYKTTISAVMPEHIDIVWDDVKMFLLRACKRSNGRHTLDTVYSQLKNGVQHLWIIINIDNEKIVACATTQISTYPTGLKMLEVVLLGGSHKDNWLTNGCKVLESWARKNNCKGMQALGRKGLKFLTVKEDSQWKEQAVMFEKIFKEKG